MTGLAPLCLSTVCVRVATYIGGCWKPIHHQKTLHKYSYIDMYPATCPVILHPQSRTTSPSKAHMQPPLNDDSDTLVCCTACGSSVLQGDTCITLGLSSSQKGTALEYQGSSIGQTLPL